MGISRSDWIDNKINIATRLYEGECDGSYAEAVLIISASISAMAAAVWPGDRIDKKRFVEIAKAYCDPSLKTTHISIPLLIEWLSQANKCKEATALRGKFMDYDQTRVLRGMDTDRSEKEILSVCPNLEVKDIRRHCYASVFYDEVRSSFVHEYKASKKTDSWAVAATDDLEISYGNWRNAPHRHIHFPIKWMASVAKSIAERVDYTMTQSIPTRPSIWWISGE